MLDPISSLLATCVNCNPLDHSVEQSNATTCHAEQRSHRGQPLHNTLTDCISPPEAASAPQPASSESGMLVSWSSASVGPSASLLASASVSSPPSASASVSNPPAHRSATPAAASHNTPVLQPGSQGQSVAALQTKLKQLGYYTGAIDGVYGAQTKAAVAQFQRSKQLQADGVVGSRTWSALQTASRPPQSEEPPSEKPPAEMPQLAWQGAPQASPPTAPQIAWQGTPQASPPAASPAASATSRLQQDRSIDVVPESPFTYLWILGWGIIYGGGWVFILKDTVKELKGFHFVLGATEKKSKETPRPMATHLQKGKKAAPTVVVIQNAEGAAESVTENVAESIAKGTVAWSTAEQKAETKPEGVFAWSTAEQKIRNKTENGSEQRPRDAQGAVAVATSVNHTPIDPQPLQAFFSIANDYTKGRSKNHSNGHSSQPLDQLLDQPLDQPAGVEEFALHDPWQEENEALSVQVFDVILADDGQVQPLQNVFVVAPRPTVYQRRRVKKPTPIIYDVKSIRQQVKTG